MKIGGKKSKREREKMGVFYYLDNKKIQRKKWILHKKDFLPFFGEKIREKVCGLKNFLSFFGKEREREREREDLLFKYTISLF